MGAKKVFWFVYAYITLVDYCNSCFKGDVSMAEEAKEKTTWGGARTGAGRKALGGKMRSLRMTDFEYDFVRNALKKIRAGVETLDVAAYRTEWEPKEKD